MYVLYYPDEGQYSVPMSLAEAEELRSEMYWAYIIECRTGEVIE